MKLIVSEMFSSEKYVKMCHFSGCLQPDWENTAWAATAGLECIGCPSQHQIWIELNYKSNRSSCQI